MPTVYKSKVDTWLLVLLVVSMVISLGASVLVILCAPVVVWWALPINLLLGVGLPLWLLTNTRYILAPNQLTIRSGPFTWQVPVSDITRMYPTRNPLSSPALSLDRLCLEYGRGKSIMISPANKEQFIQDLEQRRVVLARSA